MAFWAFHPNFDLREDRQTESGIIHILSYDQSYLLDFNSCTSVTLIHNYDADPKCSCQQNTDHISNWFHFSQCCVHGASQYLDGFTDGAATWNRGDVMSEVRRQQDRVAGGKCTRVTVTHTGVHHTGSLARSTPVTPDSHVNGWENNRGSGKGRMSMDLTLRPLWFCLAGCLGEQIALDL